MNAIVSIGVPTYNRAEMLERAVGSILAQTYEQVEVVISDNASTDGTRALCESLCQSDSRVRYVRQPLNRGSIPNFNAAWSHCRGEFAMWLADDDWLDPPYVERCLEFLVEHADFAVVCGQARYYRGERVEFDGPLIQLTDPDPARRIPAYYEQAGSDATFYGLVRSTVRRQVGPTQRVMAHDWLFAASLAFLGKVATLPDVRLHRSLGGMSDRLEDIAAVAGLRPIESRHPHASAAIHAARDVVAASPVYGTLGPRERLELALRCLPPILKKGARYRYSRALRRPRVRRVAHSPLLRRLVGRPLRAAC